MYPSLDCGPVAPVFQPHQPSAPLHAPPGSTAGPSLAPGHAYAMTFQYCWRHKSFHCGRVETQTTLRKYHLWDDQRNYYGENSNCEKNEDPRDNPSITGRMQIHASTQLLPLWEGQTNYCKKFTPVIGEPNRVEYLMNTYPLTSSWSSSLRNLPGSKESVKVLNMVPEASDHSGTDRLM